MKNHSVNLLLFNGLLMCCCCWLVCSQDTFVHSEITVVNANAGVVQVTGNGKDAQKEELFEHPMDSDFPISLNDDEGTITTPASTTAAAAVDQAAKVTSTPPVSG